MVKILTLLLLLLSPYTTLAVRVIAVDVIESNITQTINIKLFDGIAPNTVTNFLSYIDDGSYNGIFFNRSVKDFVLQTGGYTFNPALGNFTIDNTGAYNGGLQPVSPKITIANEFKLPNKRGTIAMAKKPAQYVDASGNNYTQPGPGRTLVPGTGPDSAANEWFINLSDNLFLDDSNGGFTVFGEILGADLSVIDSVGSAPTFDLSIQLQSSAFTDLPLTGFSSPPQLQDINENNLIYLRNFRYLFDITDVIDLGDPIPNTSITKNIIINNSGVNPLSIGAIDSSQVIQPLTILSNPCSNTTITPNTSCMIAVDFTPTTTDYYRNNALTVTIPGYGVFPVNIQTPAPELTTSTLDINFGPQPVYTPDSIAYSQETIILKNIGNRTLHLSSINLTQLNTTDFELVDNCSGSNNISGAMIIAPDKFCLLFINYKPSDLAVKNATVTIKSDDPINNIVTVNISGGANDDTDGVPALEEAASPNNGDSNNDSLPDKLQNNVVAIKNSDNTYTTFITSSKLGFTNAVRVPLGDAPTLPAAKNFDGEIYSFKVTASSPGAISEFGIITNPNNQVSAIYVYGPGADDPSDHWYKIDNSTTPSASALGTIILTNPTSSDFSVNAMKITVTDGGDGDQDKVTDGVVTITTAISYLPGSNASGSLSGICLLILLISVSTMRTWYLYKR